MLNEGLAASPLEAHGRPHLRPQELQEQAQEQQPHLAAALAQPQPQPQTQQLLQPQPDLLYTGMAMLSISFWLVIWVMHLCALANAKIKFKRRRRRPPQGRQQQQQQQSGAHTKGPLCCADRASKQQAHGHQLGGAYFSDPSRDLFFTKARGPPELDLDAAGRHRGSEEREAAQVAEHQQQQHLVSAPSAGPLALDACSLSGQLISHLDLMAGAGAGELRPASKFGAPLASLFDAGHQLEAAARAEQRPATPSAAGPAAAANCAHATCNSKFISLPLPGVSIVKPLVGVDKNLFYNLETFFHLDYPTYELLFCVQDPRDAAILVVEELFRKYPGADAKLFVGGARVGVNPKINNMQPAYESMKYELILISDSGISMRPDTLADMVAHMDENVALVHQMPFVHWHGRDNFQSIVERVYFGTAHARAYLTADLLNINCPTGMSALMRKCLLDEVGGIKAFGQYLAEDFFFAKSFTQRGWKLRISSQPALQNSANSSDTLSTFNSRIQRWIKLRFAMVPLITLLEPFSECMLLGLLGALSVSFLWALNPYATFGAHVLLWFALDYQLLCTIQNGPPTCRKRDYLAAWLIRECTALIVFLRALADPKVNWRSREFKIKWGGYTEEVTASGPAGREQMI